MPNRRTPDSSRRSDRSRRAIHDAALALVGEVGYARTTIEGIAARAGVGKQTIYRWWPSKAAVLMEAFTDRTVGTVRTVGAVRTVRAERTGRDGGGDGAGYAIADTGDLAADLKAVLRAAVDELNDPATEAPTRALAAEGIVDPQLGAEFAEKLLDPKLRPYVARLTAAQRAGHLRADVDPRIAVELLIAPLIHRWLLRTHPLTHEYADAVVDHALRGLSATS